jgi:hypothetical protein
MRIHAIDIDHPPGMGMADDILFALAMAYAQAPVVTAAAMLMETRTEPSAAYCCARPID